MRERNKNIKWNDRSQEDIEKYAAERKAFRLTLEARDKKDPNRSQFVEQYLPDQIDELGDKVRSMKNNPIKAWTVQEDGITMWYSQAKLVEDLKKDPLFADKSRWCLFEKIRNSGSWLDRDTTIIWHPAQEDHLRTYLWLLEDCDWRVKGKKWTVPMLAKELSTHRILRDKKLSFIKSRLYKKKEYLYNSLLNEETLLEEKEKRNNSNGI